MRSGSFSMSKSLRKAAVALFGTLLLAGCAGDANPVRDLAIASGVTGGEPRAAPDFVSRSRTGADYVPVGTSAPRRAIRAKTKAEVGAAEAEMDRIRARNEAARRKGAE
ncbi:MAG: hypothetical protein JWR86_1797 [Enterovirga sp.]|nr:hypothetical protein [Enterovirga sp.]